MEQIYNNPANTTKTNQPATYSCPVPVSMLEYLKKKGIRFRVTREKSMLSNIVNIEIDITTGLDITAIIYAAFEHDIDERLATINHRYSFKTVAA